MTPIIRLIVATLWLITTAACVINPPEPSGRSASAPRLQVSELPKSSGNTIWVLSTVGLNVRSAPDPQASKLATVAQSVELTITGKQAVGSDSWLHVKTGTGLEGWVLDKPDLVIHRPVTLHSEPSWTMLIPSEWSPTSGNPATFTGPSDPTGGSMVIQTSDDVNKLLATPMSPGKEVGQQSGIVVYGQDTQPNGLPIALTIYKSDTSGYEFVIKMQFRKSKIAYLFDYKQPGGTSPDTTLFKQLLGSLIVAAEA